MSENYHCFWIRCIDASKQYKALNINAFEGVQDLLRSEANDDIRDLKVVYGELLEFEPVEVTTAWKIKDHLR